MYLAASDDEGRPFASIAAPESGRRDFAHSAKPREKQVGLPGYRRNRSSGGTKKAWQRIRERADVPDVRIHDLRRTLGSWLSGQWYNLQLIGKALNDSSVATTQVYARLDINPLRGALERNARLMFGGGDQTDKLPS
jgi:integrase